MTMVVKSEKKQAIKMLICKFFRFHDVVECFVRKEYYSKVVSNIK